MPMLGSVFGRLIIGVLNNGLVLMEVSPFWQQIIKGFVILAAEGVHPGAKSVSQWREDFLRDYALRMNRWKSPAPKTTKSNP